MDVIALDIGGANVKVADGRGYAATRAFPLWQRPNQLGGVIFESLEQAPRSDRLAITMTGELADCFATKTEGVFAILDAVESEAGARELVVYLCDGRIASADEAREVPLLAAASNWHALATFAARYVESGAGLLIDVGSTTTDVIPLGTSGPQSIGLTDPERLVARELVYTGVERSPICAVVDVLSWRGEECPIAQELFATTVDAYLLLGEIPEDADCAATADGRPRTVENAHGRLARAVCADTSLFSFEDARRAAHRVRQAQVAGIASAIGRVCSRMVTDPTTIVISGQGEFLARGALAKLAISTPPISLNKVFGARISRAACAHALAVLSRERSAM